MGSAAEKAMKAEKQNHGMSWQENQRVSWEGSFGTRRQSGKRKQRGSSLNCRGYFQFQLSRRMKWAGWAPALEHLPALQQSIVKSGSSRNRRTRDRGFIVYGRS